MLFALPVVVAVPAIAWSVLPRIPWSSDDNGGPVMHVVRAGTFTHEITERGTVESASNVEIRCEVQSGSSRGSSYSSSSGGGGTMILSIVPEGTRVQPGDLLVTLDSSGLEDSLTGQQITCNTSKASLIQSRATHETAVIAKKEYLDGTFVQAELRSLSEIFRAEEAMRQADQLYEYGKEMVAMGYRTELQLEADQYNVMNCQKQLDLANNKLNVLRKYTKAKIIKQLESNIATTKARLESDGHIRDLDLAKLELVKTQIEACSVKAPNPGQVVYANETDRRSGSEVIIEEGIMVRERQVIIRLPDPAQMQVKAKVNEAKVSMVANGQLATIRLDAFPDLELSGTVVRVNEYPAPSSFMASAVREYETTIKINGAPPGLRPGLTAEVRIRLQSIPDVVQVPVQAVFEHRRKHYCVLHDNREYSKKEVQIGPTNDKFVVIEAGLEQDEEIVLAAAAHRDTVLSAAEKEIHGVSPAPDQGPNTGGGEQAVSAQSGGSRRPDSSERS